MNLFSVIAITSVKPWVWFGLAWLQSSLPESFFHRRTPLGVRLGPADLGRP